ncbi:MAG TPA: pyridoxine 5'-phosphate synthase [Candidatus Saccharicenans sp.]|jgi:pyridoxine 5-phosphate synthase|nr:pyridoxine 5'-phosphate synthase [Candidatus Saccharicenans sp.]HRD02005.1 pyridoxine 5'-phosphate synthase [Candidatus Saccharicenans sp.]
MKLAVNIDHIATLRQARAAREPEPVLAALLAEQAGASGIVCHLRGDRRHIQEIDLQLLRKVIITKLNLEMAATEEMLKIAREVKPDTVSLVPESPDEITTQGGLEVISQKSHLTSYIQELKKVGIRVSIFVDPLENQIKACQEAGANLIEINTGKYAEAQTEEERQANLEEVRQAVAFACRLGLQVHAGHGLDYHNVQPIVDIKEISELSIGFAIVARAVMVGLTQAVREMLELLQK